jgi:hypothetical protein
VDFPEPKYLIDARALGERLDAVTLLDLRPAEDFARLSAGAKLRVLVGRMG